MRKFKRFATLFLVLALILQTIPASALAETTPSGSAVQIGNYFNANSSTGELEGTPSIVEGNTENSYADGKVKVNKTISGTDKENEFKVKLSVKTTEKLDENIASPDVATVIVMDVSGSMADCIHGYSLEDSEHRNCESRMELAKEAAQNFINNYVDANAARKVAIVKFSGWPQISLHGAETVQGWTDASKLATSSSTSYCEAINKLAGQGGTCTEAGLILAKNLLSQTVVNSEGKEITNKNIILLTDGKPTYGTTEENSDRLDYVSINGNNIEGDGRNTSHSDRSDTHKGAENQAAAIKALGVTSYAIYVGSQDVYCTTDDCSLNTTGAGWLADYCGFTTYSTTDADKITQIFQTILNIIELKAQAWIGNDPMGSAVDFKQFNREPNPVNEFVFADNEITWDIKSGSFPAKTETANGVTTYTYELEYTITLDTLAEGFEPGKYYATNGETGITYLITENKDGKLSYEDGTAYFDVPSVKGYEGGTLEFTKVDSRSGNPLAKAKFTLTAEDDPSWTRVVESDENGYVKFENIPSGHTYTLVETVTPEGYTPVSGKVTVSYGEVTVEGLNIVDGQLADPNKLTNISGSKTWDDAQNQDGKRPDSININLFADGKLVATKTVTANDGWKWTFEGVPTHNGGKEIKYTITEDTVADYTSNVDGYDVTNTHVPVKINVEGTKTWDDNNNQDGIRPTSITVNLLADGTKVDSKTVTAEDEWSWNFTDLPKYKDQGKEIAYTVTEETVDGYDTVINGFNITNVHKPEQTSISGVKVWNDANNQDGIQPKEVTVNLLAGNEVVQTTTASAETNWTWSFTNLPKYEAGQQIVYSVEEVAIDGYEAAYSTGDNGYVTITNTHKVEKTSVPVLKVWDDADDQDGKRPDSVTVRLFADGVEKANVELNEDNKWTYVFENLDKFKEGKEIAYTVKEDAVAEYDTSINKAETTAGFVVTNKHVPSTVTVEGTKTWNDAEDQDGKRPESITIRLFADGAEVASKEVADTLLSDWTWSFTDLPEYKDGKKIVYTIVEDDVEYYDSEVNGYDVTNTHIPETINVEGTKTWVDEDNQDGKRPANITVNLLANGNKVKEAVVTPNEDGVWAYSFTDLPKYENGVVIDYTLTEDTVTNYEATVEGFNITNEHEVEKVKVEGTKTWVDNDNQDGVRPESITINLLANGEKVDSTTVTEADQWSYVFEDLDKYENGQEIVYTVTEDAVEGYSTVIEGYNVTNTHSPAKTAVSGTKVWIDADNQDGIRPDVVTIFLYADGEKVDYKEVTAEDNWAFTFDGLDKFKNGKEIVYTVSEEAVKGYDSEVEGFNVINTHEPEVLDIEGIKTWNDEGDQDGLRPESITINLLADNEIVETATVTAADEWSYSFTDLPKFKAGTEIVYTVAEVEVPGYTTEVDKYDVTNTHVPEVVSVEGTKTWDDADDQDGLRPDSITVNLVADGEEIDTVTVTEEDNWSWSFTDLPKYKDHGTEIVYTVTEDAVEEYETVVNGYDVTNTHVPETIDVEGTKTWDDADDQDGLRPEAITINLLADDEVVDTATVTESSDWSWSFTDLPKYRDHGTEIVYTVTEEAVAGYETEVDGYDVTNTHEVELTEVVGSKTWNDNDDQDGKRPASITVNLLADGVEIDEVKVTAETDWNWSFTDLPKYRDHGTEIVYTVTEDTVNEYTTEVLVTDNGFEIVNTHEIEKTTVPVSKNWIDAEDQDGVRPESITVVLVADGEETDKTLVLSEENEWSGVFEDLDVYKSGGEIEYTVVEKEVAGYTTEIVGDAVDGYVVNNTHVPEEIDIDGAKTWNDADDQDGVRPESIKVNLLADGEVVESVTVTEEDEWSWSFTDLPKYRNHGTEILYTVSEEAVAGYTTEVNGFDVTNTHEVAKVDITGFKTWDDADDQDGIRPEIITINLLADGVVVDTKTVSTTNDWAWTFAEFDKYRDQGVEIVYTIEEVEVPGYTTVVEGFNVTNSHVTETVDIDGTKTWNDADDQDGLRPESITINLLADGNQVATKTVTEADEWSYSFTDLPKYRDHGTEILYTVVEVAVDGYETTVDGFDVTNTHVPEVVTVTATKVWNDENSGVQRPEDVTVRLFVDGEKANVEPLVLSEENAWTGEFTDLPKYKDQGTAIEYTVVEDEVKNYVAKVTPEEGYNFTVTNTPVETGVVNVTKNFFHNGKLDATNATFKVALYEDAEYTVPAKDINGNDFEAKEIVLENASSATVSFENVELGKTYYVAELDKDGNPLAEGDTTGKFVYVADSQRVDYENEAVTLTEEASTAEAVVNNYFVTKPVVKIEPPEKPEPPVVEEEVVEDEVETGDDMNLGLYAAMMLAAGVGAVASFKRKKDEE